MLEPLPHPDAPDIRHEPHRLREIPSVQRDSVIAEAIAALQTEIDHLRQQQSAPAPTAADSAPVDLARIADRYQTEAAELGTTSFVTVRWLLNLCRRLRIPLLPGISHSGGETRRGYLITAADWRHICTHLDTDA